MTTWDDVCAHLAPLVAHRNADALVLVVPVGEVRLKVRVERVTAFDQPWLLFLSPVTDEHRASMRDALAFNARLAIGALALEHGWLMLRATHPMDSLDPAGLDRMIAFMARETARLRKILTLPASASARMLAYLGE